MFQQIDNLRAQQYVKIVIVVQMLYLVVMIVNLLMKFLYY